MASLHDRNKWLSRSQKRRPVAVASTAADLMVCFPTRKPIMSLMSKPAMITSPSQLALDHNSAKHGRVQRPMFKTKLRTQSESGKNHSGNTEAELSEPTSPKVTCAGQIRPVRPRGPPCKGWQSVMQEIERLHTGKKRSFKMGFKKEIMHFLSALRGLRLDFRCFGAVPTVSSCSSSCSESSDDEEEREMVETGYPRAPLSRWSTVAGKTTNNNPLFFEEEERETTRSQEEEDNGDEREEAGEFPVVPPKNALLLMRCRSAPVWLKRNEDHGAEEEDHEGVKEGNASFVLTRYAPDFFKISTDIAKETWVNKSDYYLHRSRTVRR